MATDNIALTKRYLEEVWNKGNLNVVDELSSSTAIFHDPMAKDLGSREAFKKHVQAIRAAFPDFHVKIEDISTSGDKVYMRWTTTGTHKGPFMGSGATNKRVMLQGMSSNRIQGGQIVETWMNYDQLGLLQQLGLAPSQKAEVAAAPPRAH